MGTQAFLWCLVSSDALLLLCVLLVAAQTVELTQCATVLLCV